MSTGAWATQPPLMAAGCTSITESLPMASVNGNPKQASFDVVSQTSHVRRFYAAKRLHLEGPASRGKAQRPGLVEVSDHLLMDVP